MEAASKFDHRLGDWTKPLKSRGIVLFDDLGKDQPNERISAALFAVIEHRYAHNGVPGRLQGRTLIGVVLGLMPTLNTSVEESGTDCFRESLI